MKTASVLLEYDWVKQITYWMLKAVHTLMLDGMTIMPRGRRYHVILFGDQSDQDVRDIQCRSLFKSCPVINV